MLLLLIKKKLLVASYLSKTNDDHTMQSTNAVDNYSENMGINDILRIEEFQNIDNSFEDYDQMIYQKI